MVLDKDFDDVSDHERKSAVTELKTRFSEIDKLEFFTELRYALIAAPWRSDPLHVPDGRVR
tara:strand:+ start:2734 stop:2916 length:183 start_codon:yes stop_codon:yes gene_type:complete